MANYDGPTVHIASLQPWFCDFPNLLLTSWVLKKNLNYFVLIGPGSLSRPMICLRCRSAYLKIIFITIMAMVSEAFKPRVRFSKAIYIITKYCIDIMIDLMSRVKHLLAFPSFKLSLNVVVS